MKIQKILISLIIIILLSYLVLGITYTTDSIGIATNAGLTDANPRGQGFFVKHNITVTNIIFSLLEAGTSCSIYTISTASDKPAGPLLANGTLTSGNCTITWPVGGVNLTPERKYAAVAGAVGENKYSTYKDTAPSYNIPAPRINVIFDTYGAITTGQWQNLTANYISGVYNITSFNTSELLPPSDTTPPIILQNTYNYTSDGGCTNWTTNTSTPCYCNDSTPTIKFTTDEAAICAIGKTNSNWTGLTATRNCTTTGSTDQICTLAVADALSGTGVENIYVGCKDTVGNENATSTSGPLALNYTIASNPCVIPDSGEFKLTQNCAYSTTQNKLNTKISIIGGYTLAITGNSWLKVDQLYREDGSYLYVEDGSHVYAE